MRPVEHCGTLWMFNDPCKYQWHFVPTCCKPGLFAASLFSTNPYRTCRCKHGKEFLKHAPDRNSNTYPPIVRSKGCPDIHILTEDVSRTTQAAKHYPESHRILKKNANSMLHLPSNRSDGKRRHKATLNPPKKRSHQHLTTLNKLHTPSQAVEVQMACCLVANWISCVSDGILSKSSVDVQAAGLDLLSIFSIP